MCVRAWVRACVCLCVCARARVCVFLHMIPILSRVQVRNLCVWVWVWLCPSAFLSCGVTRQREVWDVLESAARARVCVA